jgi:arginine exporter protein ArgO
VAGFGVFAQKFPLIEQAARYVGSAFLFFYAVLSLKSAFYQRPRFASTRSVSEFIKLKTKKFSG